MKAVKIIDGLYWVGAVDYDVRLFHGFHLTTPRGTTYNAYLIIDDRIALVDTVYGPFAGEMIEKIREVIDPKKIDYVIANHVETDHSGAIKDILKYCPRAKVFCTQRGQEGLFKHYFENWNFQTVKTGETLSLGKKTLQFFEAPYLHWPDSMFTYIQEDAVLLPNDAFGQHYGTSERFDDEVPEYVLMSEAQKYYANILTPFSVLVAKKLQEIKEMNLPIKIIAPSHGIIWRKNPQKIITAYQQWADGQNDGSVLVIYDSMWKSTESIARQILEGILSENIPVKLIRSAVTDRCEMVKDILTARALVIGSSTINRGVLPSVSSILDELEGLRFRNKVGTAFGSYGWSGEGPGLIAERMKKAGLEIIAEPLKIKWVPDEPELKASYQFGQKIGQLLKK